MSDLVIFSIMAGGMGIGSLIAHLVAKNDNLAKFLWMFLGVMPGVSLLTDYEPLWPPMLFGLFLILMHHLWKKRKEQP